jgi:hypothetical protein
MYANKGARKGSDAAAGETRAPAQPAHAVDEIRRSTDRA